MLEEVAAQAARRQVALEDLPEAYEHARLDDPDDLAVERRLPSKFEKSPLQEPGEAE